MAASRVEVLRVVRATAHVLIHYIRHEDASNDAPTFANRASHGMLQGGPAHASVAVVHALHSPVGDRHARPPLGLGGSGGSQDRCGGGQHDSKQRVQRPGHAEVRLVRALSQADVPRPV